MKNFVRNESLLYQSVFIAAVLVRSSFTGLSSFTWLVV